MLLIRISEVGMTSVQYEECFMAQFNQDIGDWDVLHNVSQLCLGYV